MHGLSVEYIKETYLDNVELFLVGLGGPVVLDDVPEVMLTEVQQQPHLPAGQQASLPQVTLEARGKQKSQLNAKYQVPHSKR
jgi:hypothetical protein